MSRKIVKELSFSRLTVSVEQIGGDYHILLQGGTVPHIGCTVLAVPRPSLTGDGGKSSTASVLNVTGHKDELLCRCLAETVSAQKEAVVVCSGGFHVDGITKEQIEEVREVVEQIGRELADEQTHQVK